MDAARRALVGLDAGVKGGLAAIAWFILHSWLGGEYWFTKLNVASGLLLGDRVFRSGASWATMVGFALFVVLYGVVGLVAAWILPGRSGFLVRLAVAILVVSVFHYGMDHGGWSRIGPFAPSYFPGSATVPADLALAAVLTRVGRVRTAQPGPGAE